MLILSLCYYGVAYCKLEACKLMKVFIYYDEKELKRMLKMK